MQITHIHGRNWQLICRYLGTLSYRQKYYSHMEETGDDLQVLRNLVVTGKNSLTSRLTGQIREPGTRNWQ